MRPAFRPDSGRFITLEGQNAGGFDPSYNNLPSRVIQISGDKDLDPWTDFSAVVKAFPVFYEKLVRCEPVECQCTGTTFPALRSPTLVVLDVRSWPCNLQHACVLTWCQSDSLHIVFLLPILEAIRAQTGSSVPILAWSAANAFLALRLFGPEELGGIGDVLDKARAVVEQTGRDEKEVIEEVAVYTSIVWIPNLTVLWSFS